MSVQPGMSEDTAACVVVVAVVVPEPSWQTAVLKNEEHNFSMGMHKTLLSD